MCAAKTRGAVEHAPSINNADRIGTVTDLDSKCVEGIFRPVAIRRGRRLELKDGAATQVGVAAISASAA
jgi:hypothetical protein